MARLRLWVRIREEALKKIFGWGTSSSRGSRTGMTNLLVWPPLLQRMISLAFSSSSLMVTCSSLATLSMNLRNSPMFSVSRDSPSHLYLSKNALGSSKSTMATWLGSMARSLI